MNKLLKYLRNRDLQSKVKEAQDNADKKGSGRNWVQEKSESFTAKFSDELACIIDAGIYFKIKPLDAEALLITFHYDYNGSTFLTSYISEGNWSPDWKSFEYSDYPTHYLLDVVGDWYKSLLPAPAKKEPVILSVSLPSDIYKGQAAQVFKVECPFQSNELCSSDMAKFKYKILDAYNLIGWDVTADFDFDIG